MSGRDDLPDTDAGLYDLLQQLFGLGNFDEIAGGNERWHEARMREIAKLKAQRRARHVSVESLAITALYCHRHRIPVIYPSQLYAHILNAHKAHAHARTGTTAPGVDDYDDAIEYERNQPDSEWLSRLLRATGQVHRQHTLTEWKKARGR